MIRNDIWVTIRNSRISTLFILIFISNVLIKSFMVSFYPFTWYLLYVFCLMYVHIPPWLWAIMWELGIEPGSSENQPMLLTSEPLYINDHVFFGILSSSL